MLARIAATRLDQTDTSTLDAVLARLRRQHSAARQSAPQPPRQAAAHAAAATATRPQAQDANAQTTADTQPTQRAQAYAPPQPQPQPQPQLPDPRQRLRLARAALLSGRDDAAQQYLEEAQLQLVFRPVAPDSSGSAGGSAAAGDVASALSMLAGGDVNGALQYIDRAMTIAAQGRQTGPVSYGYAGPYGAPPGQGVASAYPGAVR